MRVKQLFWIALIVVFLVSCTFAQAPTPAENKGANPAPATGAKPTPVNTPKNDKVEPVKQAEPPKAEAPKAEAPKAEPVKVETPKAEPPKPQAAKTEPPKPAAPKAEVPKAAEPPKAEAPKVEPVKTEPPKAAEPAKPEAPKVEPVKAEAPKPPKAEAPKAEAPKAQPKTEQKKAEPKKETIPNTPKSEPASEKSVVESFVDTYVPLMQEYSQQAIAISKEYGQLGYEKLQELSAHGKDLAGDYYVVAANNFEEYKKLTSDVIYDQSVKAADRFLDPQHAQIVKKNYFNWYGVGILVGVLFGFYLVSKQLGWFFSVTALRAFVSATALGVYGTLATLYVLSGKDPLSLVPASTKAGPISHLGEYVAALVGVLSVLSVVALPRKVRSVFVLLLTAGLFVDRFELRSQLESAVGTIPPHALEATIFLLQTILIFGAFTQHKKVVTKKTVLNPIKSEKQPAMIKQEKKVEKKTK